MKKANQILVTFISCIAFIISFAQEPLIQPQSKTIVGKVVDSATGIPLSQVSIIVRATARSEPFVSILTNDSGFFELPLFDQQQYLVTYSFIGYKTISQHINTQTCFLGIIQLPSLAKLLKEVQVTIKQPIIEQKLDKLIYNVDVDPESKTASALDILRKVPMLTLDVDDNLFLNGNSNFRVLINGKPSSLFANNQGMIFNSIPADFIKSIEIITAPSSRYEPQGLGGIINIITHRKSIGGYNVGLNLRAANPKGYVANGNFTVTQGSVGIAGHYGYSANSNPSNKSLYIRKDNIYHNQLEQQGTTNNSSKSQNWGSEFTWTLTPFNLITASFSNYNSNGQNSYIQQANLFNASNVLTQAYKLLNESDNKTSGNDLTIDFEHDFGKNKAQQLAFAYRRNKSTAGSMTNLVLHPIVNYHDRESITNNDDKFNEQSFQTDLRLTIRQHTLELGANRTERDNSSDYFYLNKATGIDVFVLDSSQSNSYKYRETIYGGYSTFNMKTGKWGMIFGVRMENARVHAEFISSRTKTKQQYFNLLPSITLSRQLKGLSMLKFTYVQRIQRPDLYYMDPYINISDPYNISYGNPNLQPALSHIFNLSFNIFIKKVFLNLNASHQFTNNSIQQITVFRSDSISHTTFGNIGKNRSYVLSFSGNAMLLRKLNINLGVSSIYMQYSTRIIQKDHLNEGLTYTISSSFNIRQKSWRASFSMSYYSPNILVQGRSASYVANSLTINKSFLKDKSINVGLSISSPFQQYRQYSTLISGPSFNQVQQSTNIIRRFNLSFNYRFAKVQANSNANMHHSSQ